MEWNVIISTILQKVLEFTLPIVVVSIVSFLVAKAREVWEKAKAINPKMTDYLEQAANLAVVAAEQAGAAELIDDKREYAFGIARNWLKANGLNLDPDLIYAAIEAAVYQEFNSNKIAE